MRTGYNPKIGTIKTDANVAIDRSFLAHFSIAAADATAVDTDGVLTATNLGAAAQAITTNIISPNVPRNITIVGNVSGIDGKVTISGTNYAGATITEDITANGTTGVVGAKAFKTVTSIALPIQDHTPTAQVETATAAGTITTAGNAAVTVTTALLEAAEEVAVPVLEGDDASDIATAIRTALAANENIAANFTVSGATDKVILTAKVPAANDATLNIAIADGSGDGASSGVTTAASSANTTGGVPYDTISVGFGKVFGLPYKLEADEQVIVKLFDKSADTGTVVASATALESNTFAVNGTPDGVKAIDLYIIV